MTMTQMFNLNARSDDNADSRLSSAKIAIKRAIITTSALTTLLQRAVHRLQEPTLEFFPKARFRARMYLARQPLPYTLQRLQAQRLVIFHHTPSLALTFPKLPQQRILRSLTSMWSPCLSLRSQTGSIWPSRRQFGRHISYIGHCQQMLPHLK